MKNKPKCVVMYFVTAAIMLFSSCRKGDTGPAGPAGNANVQAYLFSVPESGTTINTGWAENAGYFYEHIENNIDILTQAIVDSGAVMLYVNDYYGWAAMPYTEVINVNQASRHYTYTHSLHQVYIKIEQTDGSVLPNLDTETYFKLVAIPASFRHAHPNINLNDYEEMKKLFDLKDQPQPL